MSILCLLVHGVSNMGFTWQWVSILCPKGQGCLFCASWNAGYLICASNGRGCLFRSQQGRSIYCVPHRTGVSIVCLHGHGVSNMGPHGNGCLFCAQQDRGVYCVPPGTQEDLIRFTQDIVCLLCALEDSISLLCVRESWGVYCVPHRAGVSIVCDSQDRCVYSVLPGAQCL